MPLTGVPSNSSTLYINTGPWMTRWILNTSSVHSDKYPFLNVLTRSLSRTLSPAFNLPRRRVLVTCPYNRCHTWASFFTFTSLGAIPILRGTSSLYRWTNDGKMSRYWVVLAAVKYWYNRDFNVRLNRSTIDALASPNVEK